MNVADLQPTPIVDPGTRPPVPLRAVEVSGHWRGATVAVAWLAFAAGEIGRGVWRERDPRARGRRLRELLERLGGVWIKVGQLLSLRVDLFDAALCDELTALQDRAHGFAGELARERIEADLGVPIGRVFASFELQPIAAASIGQVHRGRLLDGRWVAVKVRRPFIEDALQRELALVGRLFGALDRLRVAPFMRWRNMRWELGTMLTEELDYRREASALERLRATLNPRGMYVPAVHRELCSERVLTMEFVSGVLLSDYIAVRRSDPERVREWNTQNHVDPRRIVNRFTLSILRQILEDNLYHGDLHPGNIVLLRDSRVALLDFGAVGFTERDYLDRVRLFLHAMGAQEYERAADLALLMSSSLPNIDLAPARAEVVRALHAWGRRTDVRSLPYPEKSVDAVNVAITRIFFTHRITFEWAFLRIRRALATMDATALHLHPDADHAELTRRYFAKATQRAIRAHVRRREATGRSARAGNEDVVRQVGELADLAVQIERRRLAMARATVTGGARIVTLSAAWARLLATACASAGVLLLAAQHGPRWAQAAARFVTGGLIDRAPAADWQIWLALSALGVLAARTAAGVRAGFTAAATSEGHGL